MQWLDKKNPDGNKMVELENNSITCYFFSDKDEGDGVIVDNHTNEVLTWNTSGVTHVNIQNKKFSIMVLDDSQLMLSYGDDEEKNILLDIDTLVELVKTKGKTIEELEEENKDGESGKSEQSDNGTEEGNI